MKGINANIVKYVDARQWFVTIWGGVNFRTFFTLPRQHSTH